VDSVLGFGLLVPILIPSSGKKLVFLEHHNWVRIWTLIKEVPPIEVSMGHMGASKRSPNEVPWETLSQTFKKPILRYWQQSCHGDMKK